MITRRSLLMRAAAAGVISAGSLRISDGNLVETLRGPLDVSKLGFTLSHEHVCVFPREIYSDRAVAVARMSDKLHQAHAAGVDTVIDLTTADVGRDVRFGEEVSRRSGMQIVVSTGFRFAPDSYNGQTIEQIAEVFIREIEQGIEATGIKAGVIKVAARSAQVLRAEEKGFKAAALASKVTGVPIETHTDARRRGGETQADIFEAEGINPARVALGHSDDTDDVEYLLGLAKRGYTLGIDHAFYGAIASSKDQPDYIEERRQVSWQKRAGYIKQLIDAGFGDRIFLSNDWELDREQINPDGLLFNTRKTIPYLTRIGVSQREIGAIAVDNPRRFFGRRAAQARWSLA